MPYQSTKRKYKTRGEKNKETYRRARLIFWGVIVVGAILILKDWRDHWAYLKTYFMD